MYCTPADAAFFPVNNTGLLQDLADVNLLTAKNSFFLAILIPPFNSNKPKKKSVADIYGLTLELLMFITPNDSQS